MTYVSARKSASHPDTRKPRVLGTPDLAASPELLPGNKAIQAQGALPLSYDIACTAMNGGIRTRDLPLNRRSIPNLRHR